MTPIKFNIASKVFNWLKSEDGQAVIISCVTGILLFVGTLYYNFHTL